MTNSWSMLYDEILKMDDHINLNIPNGNIDIAISPATPFKYNEEEIVKELLEYITVDLSGAYIFGQVLSNYNHISGFGLLEYIYHNHMGRI